MNQNETLEDSSNLRQYFPHWFWIYLLPAAQLWRDFVENLVLASIATSHFLILYAVIGALTYFYLLNYTQTKENHQKRVLFVIAHPDDEVMFFGPTILHLVNSSEVYLLCLSMGNYYEKNCMRKEELYKSCKVLGIPQSNIMLMNNTRMPDNPSVVWNAKDVSKILLDFIEMFSISEVYTFDIGGVSGHLNHISVFYGFAHICLSDELTPGVKVFLLDSVNILRKYSAFFDAALSALPFSKKQYIVPFRDSSLIRRGMFQHKSQMVWFRALYIYFCRYMYINTYKELEPEDVQLVLQMSDYNPSL